MIRRCTAAGLLALSVLLAGCPESVHPVSDPATAVHDPELFGVWHGTFEDDTHVYLHIGPAEHGMTRAVMIEHRENGRGIKIENYVAFPTRLPKLKLLNVRSLDDASRGYTIIRYKVEGDDEMTFWITSYPAVREDIKAGKLRGVAEAGQFGDTRITASSVELAAYLHGSDGDRLFDKPLEFERVEP
jgi:hypothetical protein